MSQRRTIEASFADDHQLLPIGGEVTEEIEVLDRLLVLVAKQARAVDKAGDGGMWRTWMLHALGDVEQQAHTAATRALKALPAESSELRDAIERRCAGLNVLMARYAGRLGLL